MGLVVLHGNQLETLRDIAIAWVAGNPLDPFDDEVVLVQSNGIAQWFKMGLARPRAEGGLGIAAGVSVELPARFLWRCYRRVLGEGAVLEDSPYAKHRLTWRLMRLLPALSGEPVMAPVARYLEHDPDGRKQHAFAVRVADLFDQYQVYRADWLDAWEAGRDALPDALRGDAPALVDEMRWQPYLWRALQADMARTGEGWERVHRGAVHAAFLARIRSGEPKPAGFPSRIVVFGLSSLPQQALEALAALGAWSEVIICVLNPSQHYWADTVEDRELLRAAQQRQRRKDGTPTLPAYHELHLYANPLLAAWGKQGRDFIRLLDTFDNPADYRDRLAAAGARIDAFEEPDRGTVLGRLQAAVLDLEPRPSAPQALPAGDRSLQFAVCHSAQREVEVLHDTLLALFDEAHAQDAPLQPADVIVMVPDIEVYAPIVEAVFGEVPPGDPRHVPIAIADRTARRADPLVRALEFVLQLPESKLPLSDVLDLLDLPVVSRRLGLTPAQVPVLRGWIEGAGIRWGLDGAHRAQLGLGAAGEQNTWWFGLRRMLLGYLSGDAAGTQAIEPYPEVGGLEAEAVGALYTLLERLSHHAAALRTPAPPAVWGERVRAVMDDFLAPTDDAERIMAERVGQALADWLDACADAALGAPLDVAVVREALLAGLDEVRLSQRFLGGGVMFASLMPMRAIPFRVIALLGMNDGDYPRTRAATDFDLMALPGRHRPGDRSRRDDDRYLFLEALLSARRRLLVSWCGRNVRDNTHRPPSVLVGQLRDYVDALFLGEGGRKASDALTTTHPLQPFSRRYAEGVQGTYRHEWLALHAPRPLAAPLPPPARAEGLTDGDLGLLLSRPVPTFFQRRLGVSLDVVASAASDDEAFVVDGLERYAVAETVLHDALAQADRPTENAVEAAITRVARTGRLPIGQAAAGTLDATREAVREVAAALSVQFAEAKLEAVQPRIEVRIGGIPVTLRDAALRRRADGSRLRLAWSPNSLISRAKGKTSISLHRMLRHWPAHLLAQCAGEPVTTRIEAPGGALVLQPVEQGRAIEHLEALVAAWHRGLAAPLPIAPKTAFAYVGKATAGVEEGLKAARGAFEGNRFAKTPGEGDDPYIRRAFPTFQDLVAGGFTDWVPLYAPVAASTQEAR